MQPNSWGTDLGVVFVGIDGKVAGQVFQGRRKGLDHMDADLVGAELFGLFDLVDVPLGQHLVFRVADEMEGVDHLVCVELFAVVEDDPLP